MRRKASIAPDTPEPTPSNKASAKDPLAELRGIDTGLLQGEISGSSTEEGFQPGAGAATDPPTNYNNSENKTPKSENYNPTSGHPKVKNLIQPLDT